MTGLVPQARRSPELPWPGTREALCCVALGGPSVLLDAKHGDAAGRIVAGRNRNVQPVKPRHEDLVFAAGP